MAVILNAPAVFRFTASTNPEKHLEAARLMGVDTTGAAAEDAGELLAGAIISLMQKTGVPNGLGAIGFTEADIPAPAEVVAMPVNSQPRRPLIQLRTSRGARRAAGTGG